MNSDGLSTLGLAYYLIARYEDAIRILERCVRQNPDFQYGHVVLAATYGKLGHLEEASRAVQAIKRLNPFFETKGYGSLFRDRADAAKVVDGLRKAGLK
jgi:tetratricopeptide (TPR) repeat protein